MAVQVGDYTVSTDKAKLELDVIHAYLTKSYWAEGIPREVVARSLETSLCFGVYQGREQVGLARVVTDYATFVYVADVFVLEAHRGRSLGVALLDAVVNHPDLAGVRTWLLLTSAAIDLGCPRPLPKVRLRGVRERAGDAAEGGVSLQTREASLKNSC